MMEWIRQFPIELSMKIKDKFGYIPVFLLLNSNTDNRYLENDPEKVTWIDGFLYGMATARSFSP